MLIFRKIAKSIRNRKNKKSKTNHKYYDENKIFDTSDIEAVLNTKPDDYSRVNELHKDDKVTNINTEDASVIKYLKMLTLLPREEIEAIEKEHLEAPEKRVAQKRLAQAIITDLHGEEAFEKAVDISQKLFLGQINEISPKDLLVGLKDVPHSHVPAGKLIDVLVQGKICSSKREANEFLRNNAISLNGEIVNDADMMIDDSKLLGDEFLIIRRGKKKYHVVTLEK